MEKKQVYEKPALRKVRLDVKTAVLAECNLSNVADPAPLCAVEGSYCILVSP